MTTPTARTPTAATPASGDQPAETRAHAPGGLGLSAAQVAGSALAAVSGAFLASWLGVTGTLVGVAVGSVVGTVGSASYTYSLRRGHALVARPGARLGQQADGELVAETTAVPVATPVRRRREPLALALPWRRLGVAAVVAALVGLGGLTLLETVTGRPVSSVAGRSTDTGTTLGSVLGQGGGSVTTDDPASDTGQDGSGPGGADSGAGDGSEQPTDTSGDQPTDVPSDQPETDPTTPPDPTPDPSPVDPTPIPGAPVAP